MSTAVPPQEKRSSHSVWEVLLVFLRLGLTSFGGPVAHLGYFRTELVERRRWLNDKEYADLVALSQFLPGPASSQVGFGIGLRRAGLVGALAAFIAFTAPSALIMVLFAYGASLFEGAVGEGVLVGLKTVAVAIVAHAVLGMAKSLTPDKERAAIAVVAAAAALLLPGSLGQIVAIVFGAVAGVLFFRGVAVDSRERALFPVSRAVGIASLVAFVILLFGLPLLVAAMQTGAADAADTAGAVTATAATAATASGTLGLVDIFYRAGALVFGGGHVVLPLLQAALVEPGLVSAPDFLAGYGVAQAVPGPLFTFAAFLGAVAAIGPGGIVGAIVATLAVFLPGFLLLLGALPFWNQIQHRRSVQALMRGANAAVVGILGAALYSPVFTSTITGPGSFTLALACFVALVSWKLPPWAVVIIGAAGGVILTVL